jgi:hypothetical protein
MRTENLRKLVIGTLSVVVMLLAASFAEACSCEGRQQGVKGVQTCGYYGVSEDIFIGLAETVEIDRKAGSLKVTFAVEKPIRGTIEKKVEVFTSADEGSCGYPFKQGERYFVYGRKGKNGKYRESLCGPTTLLKDAEDDLEYVKAIEDGELGTRIFGRVFEDKQPTLKDKRTAEPLAGIEITIVAGQNRYRTFTDEKGGYLFKNVPDDRYQVFAKLPRGYRELYTRADPTNHYTTGCSSNYFRVTKQGSLRGKVVNFPSKEIQNPWNRDVVQQPKVTLIPLDDGGKPIQNVYHEEKWAYRDKFEYFFDAVPAGNYLVAINPNNCPYPNNGIPSMYYPGVASQAEAKIVTVREGEHLTLGDFRSLPMLKERWFSGVVLNDDLTPAVNARVQIMDASFGNGKCSNGNLETKSDEFGRFRLKGFESYEFSIAAYSEKKDNQKQKYTKRQTFSNDAKVDSLRLVLDQSF